jgi:GAF domain-containing protein/HAMP domain-containing protein
LRGTLFIGIAVAAVTALGAARLAQVLARPIVELNQAAQQIIAGDLTMQVEARSQDEVGALAETFNAMTTRLRNLIASLEQRVAERTRELERRATQIATGAEISRAASRVLDPDALLSQVVSLMRERFELYYAAVFVVDEAGQYAVLRAGTGEAGRIMAEGGHKLAVGGNSMVGWVCANRLARIALDVGQDAVRFANPLLPETRSEMALPLRVGERVMGALDIQSRQASAFDEDDITALQGMADQIAVALENARLFQQAQAGLQEVERVNRLLTQSAWESFLRGATSDFSEFHVPGGAPFTPEETARLAQTATLSGPTRQDLARQALARQLSVPVKVRDQVIGTLVAERDETQPPWSESERAMLEAMLAQVGDTLDSARLYEETQRNAARQRLIAEATARMRATLDLDTVIETGMQELSRALGAAALDVQLDVQGPTGRQP